VAPRDVGALLDRAPMPGAARVLAGDACGRLLLAEAMRASGGPTLALEADAGALALLCAAAVALHGLRVDRVVVSRIGVEAEPPPAVRELLGDWAGALDFGAGRTGSDGAALLRALCEETDVAQPAPPWVGHVTTGRAQMAPRVVVQMGNLSGTSSNL
jgi:hypothetical protein